MKRTTKTTVNEYDAEGKLVKSTETIVETDETPTWPTIPAQPYQPWRPYPYQPTITYTTSGQLVDSKDVKQHLIN